MRETETKKESPVDEGAEFFNSLQELQLTVENMERMQSGVASKLERFSAIEVTGDLESPAHSVEEMLSAVTHSLMGNFGCLSALGLMIDKQANTCLVACNLGFEQSLLRSLTRALPASEGFFALKHPLIYHNEALSGISKEIRDLIGLLWIKAIVPFPIDRWMSAYVLLGPRLGDRPFTDHDVQTLGSMAVSLSQGMRIIRLQERLLSEQRESFRIRGMLEEFVAPEIVGHLLSGRTPHRKSARQKVTVLTADIMGFSSIAASMEPELLIQTLNRFFSRMSAIVMTHGGIIDKFMGDAVLAMFGVPSPAQGDAERAVRTAVDMQEAFRSLAGSNDPIGSELAKTGLSIGISTGDAVVGAIGSGRRVEFTAIGSTVAASFTLCTVAGRGETLVDGPTRTESDPFFTFRQVLAPDQSPGNKERYKLVH